ncbi:MAG: hypothetical protein FGM46_06340 [Ferruginibacter sp.]|nr:hypothetical protein [Ferruginibacter sp.]
MKKVNASYWLIILSIITWGFSSCKYNKEEILYVNTGDCSNPNIQAGPKFSAVQTLIQSSCGGGNCHLNGGNAGGYNFDNACRIVNRYNSINDACVVRSTMPQSNPFNSTQKKTITDWISAGHKYTD